MTCGKFIIAHIYSFIDGHCNSRKEQMQLMVYLVFSVMIIFGMPLHFVFGLVGYDGILFQILSLAVWVCGVIFLILYLSGRMSMTKAFFWLSVSYQFVESVGIVYIAAMARPEWMEVYQKLMLVNEILSLVNLLIVCMGLVPHASTVAFAIFSLSMGVAYVICPEVMLSQFVLLFFYAMLGIWIYSLVMQRLVNSTTREISDYKQFQDSVLDMFHMSKTELVALIQLCRGAKRAGEMDKGVMSHLTEQTRHNLIALGDYLQNEHRDQTTDLSAIFPQLTPAELGVARLILKNMTLKEIAVATDKSLSNVGTVRGNIRKKLGLAPEDDLREWLLAAINRKSRS